MSDIEIPIYVARAKWLPPPCGVQLPVLAKMDRERSRESRGRGLDDNNKYRLADIFVSRFKGRTEEGG